MTTRRPLLLLAALCLGLSPAAGDDPPARAEPKYAPMPWHLVDTWWDTGKDAPFESLAVDVTVSDDVPSSVNLYIAPIGLGHLNKTPFYGGVQTQADGYTKAAPKLRTIGPGFLFSMWGERSAEAIRPADGGLFQSSGHEGDFVSVRRPYKWAKGKYTYRLTKMDREEVSGKPHTWVGAFVYSHEKDENEFVGALRFPGENLVLDRKVANFVEVYGRRRPVADIPKVTVTFGPPVVNGAAVKGATAEAVYPKGVPDYADAVAKDGSLVVTVGTPVEGREKRRVSLIGATKPSGVRQPGVIRDIFGNPFRPVSPAPAWLTQAVTSLASAIYADRAFGRLPSLADALEAAGCDDPAVLTHCRGSGPHFRGCWVVDLLLGKA